MFIGRFLRKFAVKRILETPSHLAYVATLPYNLPPLANLPSNPRNMVGGVAQR